MSERIISLGGVELCSEAFGEISDPPLLLVMGAMASMLWWPDAFCRRLAGSGRYVIRYDNRDTGRSTSYPLGEPGYSTTDMVDDTIAVLDAYGVSRAHLVGMSMGGMIAQQAALRHPERFETLTAISTSPLGLDGLPGMTDAYAAHAATGEAVDWSSRESVIDFMTRDARAVSSTAHPHDADAARRLIERDIDRARSFASATNHFMVVEGSGPDGRSASDLSLPLLVIHGTSDPIFPVAHGEALAKAVEDAGILRIQGGGHELHEADWPAITDAILAHTAR